MEYKGYYEDDTEKRTKNRGSIGSYVATAVIFMVFGALLASCFMPKTHTSDSASANYSTSLAPTASPQSAASVESDDSKTTASPSAAPQQSFSMPELDGVAPEIYDTANPLPDLIEQVKSSMVGIINYAYYEKYEQNLANATGSGFIISSDGYIVTNAHVVEGCDSVGVLLDNENKDDIVAQVVGYDKKTDIAVLKIDAAELDLSPVKIGDSDTVRVGDFVIAIGDPTGRELAGTATFGIVSALNREINVEGRTNSYIQVDAALNPGNSGGALFSLDGEVVGVVSAKSSNAGYDEDGVAISAEGLGFVLPIDKAMEVAEELLAKGSIQRAGMGISVVTIDEINAIEYDIPQGILVYSVTKDGPGHKAGLQIDDIIIECEGERTYDQTIFVEEIAKRTVGDTLKIKVWRYGEEIEFTVELADLNSLGSELVDGYAKFDWNSDSDEEGKNGFVIPAP